jgi:hypothetical protein
VCYLNPSKRIILTASILIAIVIISTVGVNQLLADEYDVQARKMFQDAIAKVEQIRNVTINENINLHIISKQQAVDMWGKPTDNVDLTNINRQERIYKGLFMMPETDSLYQATSEWTANWGAATVGKNDIYVIRENFDAFAADAEATFIHELTHIWQPQLKNPTTYDEDKAHAALVEGDASFMGDYYKNIAKTQATTLRAGFSLPFYLIDNPLLDNVHPMSQTLWDLNYFPYDQGKIFVTALHEKGGFSTMNQAYIQGYTPSATSLILHPEKYFENVTAQSVNAPTPAKNDWTLIQTDRGQDHNTYGEYFIKAMLTTWLNKTVAQQAAEGWSGDTFTYYERGTDFLFTWNIKWETNCDASDFYIAFHNMASNAGVTDNGSCNWYSNGRYLSIAWNQDQNTTLIECSTDQSETIV